MSEVEHVEGEVVKERRSDRLQYLREGGTKTNHGADSAVIIDADTVVTEVSSEPAKSQIDYAGIFSRLRTNPHLQKIASDAIMKKAVDVVVKYDQKFGAGAACESAEIARDLTAMFGGDVNKVVAMLDKIYEVLPSEEQVQAKAAIPSAAVYEEPVNFGGIQVIDEVPPVTESNVMGVKAVEDQVEIKAKAEEYASQMLHSAVPFGPQILDEARTAATAKDVESFETFQNLCLSLQNKANREFQRQKELAEAAKSSLQQWEEQIKREHPDVQAYAQQLLDKQYNLPEGMIGIFDVQLGAYTVPGLANPDVKLRQEIGMDNYSNPAFAIIRFVAEKPVQAAVDRCLEALASVEFEEFVNSMLMSSELAFGKTIDEKRSYLTDIANKLPQIQGKTAPDNYKIWYLLTRQRGTSDNAPEKPIDMTAEVMREKQSAIDLQARTEEKMSTGIPQVIAMDAAYRETVCDMPEEEAKKRGLLDTAGHVIGTIAATPARCKKSVQDAMYEAMGEYGDEWKANAQAAKERKKELRERKQEQEFELEKKRLEMEMQQKTQENMMKIQQNQTLRQQPVYGQPGGYGYGQPAYGRHGYNNAYGRQGSNFAPHIPVPVIMIGVHLIVGLLLWAICGNGVGIAALIGLGMATVGMFMFRTLRAKAVLIVLAGYILTVLSVIL